MIWQNDTAFFQAQLADAAVDKLINPRDIKGLHVTEEINQMTTGQISLIDNKNIYSRILKRGAKLKISWGYKSISQRLDFLNPGADTAIRGLVRRGLEVTVQGPSGGGDNGGIISYNVGFLATAMRGTKEHIIYESGTKQQVVEQVMNRIGVVLTEVLFDRMQETYSSESYERQYETDFQTLARWAREWRVIFRLGHTPDGNLAGIFIDPYRLPQSNLIPIMSGAGVQTADLWYRAGKSPNLLNYDWQHQDGLNGSGDGVNVTVVNGQTQFIRYHVEDEKVTAWRLNPDKIQAELNGRDAAGQAALTQEILGAQSFSQVQRFFDPIESSTAPNGIGYSVTGRLIGTPYLIPGITARFYGNMPDFLTNPNSGNSIHYFFRKVDHDLSLGGYFTDFDIADVYSQSPTGAIL